MLLGQVYFMAEREGGRVTAIKIGYIGPNESVWERRSTLQTGNPREVKLLAHFEGVRTDERFLHFFFRAFKIRGEWFNPDPRLQTFIQSCERLRELDFVGLAPCAWTKDANGKRSRATRHVCLHCPRCERPETAVQAELRRELEARAIALTSS